MTKSRAQSYHGNGVEIYVDGHGGIAASCFDQQIVLFSIFGQTKCAVVLATADN